jgi:PhoD-like phosphatase
MLVMARLILGPLVRYVAGTAATVWVETDAACEVSVLGRTERTFNVEGHHYALVQLTGLTPGEVYEYEVELDGERAWPRPGHDDPRPSIRPPLPDARLRVAFGSCRRSLPHDPPYTNPKEDHDHARGPDALYAYWDRISRLPRDSWPDLLLLLGDQVYADETSPRMHEAIRARRDPEVPPGYGIKDFEEYTLLYREAWQDPAVRLLLASVPTAMMFDDHDIHDDWNTSETWVRNMRAKPWWQERIVGGLMSYWIYQHIGNLSPEDLADDPVYTKVLEAGRDGDAGPVLREFAARADRNPAAGVRWSYARDLGRTRLVMIDSRCGRVLTGGRRSMLDEAEWRWLDEQLAGGFDHLLLGTSLPFLLVPSIHLLEAWNERLAAGAWGRPGVWLGERIRQAMDLEHWAAFSESFNRLAHIIGEVAAGRRGHEPASIVLLSGDVHHAYLAEATFPGMRGVPDVTPTPVFQAVCSPIRNVLERSVQRVNRLAKSHVGARIGGLVAATTGAKLPSEIAWRITDGPWYENQIATIETNGRAARLTIERAMPEAEGPPRLEPVLDKQLTDGQRARGEAPAGKPFSQPAQQ